MKRRPHQLTLTITQADLTNPPEPLSSGRFDLFVTFTGDPGDEEGTLIEWFYSARIPWNGTVSSSLIDITAYYNAWKTDLARALDEIVSSYTRYDPETGDPSNVVYEQTTNQRRIESFLAVWPDPDSDDHEE